MSEIRPGDDGAPRDLPPSDAPPPRAGEGPAAPPGPDPGDDAAWARAQADGPDPSAPERLLAAAPGLMRLAAGVWWRSAEWYVEGVRRVLGVHPESDSDAESRRPRQPDTDPVSLRDRGAELLRRSADVNYDERTHPAYERIIEVLAPDEARILRLLAREGAQPAVDVRTARPFGIGSHLVEPGLTMIGAEAGCRHLDRVNSYLNNLFRLGLIWFSRETVLDPLRYQVLEAQPEVLEALERAGRGRTVRRSIHLTPFGEDFCAVCLPPEVDEPALGPDQTPGWVSPGPSNS